MRALWAAGGSAVLGSALLGVLVGVAIHAAGEDDPLSPTPASTWIKSTATTPSSSVESTTPESSAPSSSSAAPSTQQTIRRTTTPPPAVVNTAPPPPPATTTRTTTSPGWPCSPLNPLPPPSCKNFGD
ncbi:hypothetical protein [Lentzea nigeriaca]|uniref:hypothetical protein n=1 Tax=Lentzea nigeriaca TaxID=1128665 RepID=UPI00195A3343|nr:hypothetical protein [Lentzea nigeriaca]MBM7862823.1 cytoskeletal protein RodZ [Lentzea nigeriaca]